MIRLPRLLDSNLNEVRRIEPLDGSLFLSMTPLSTATLTLTAEQMIPARSWVEMYNAYGSVGVFRVRSVGNVYGTESSTVELDHAIAEVGDYVCDTTINKSAPLNQAIAEVFTFYKGNKWRLDTLTFTDGVVVDIAYESVLEGILGLLRQVPEYYLTFNFNTSPWTVGLAKRGTTVSAEGRLSRNIQEASVSYDDSDLCTRVYVEVDNGNGNTSIVHYDADTIGTYGLIEYFIPSSGYNAQQAETVALAYLKKHKKPLVAVSITGYDFYVSTGETLDRLEIGKLYRLALPKYGVTVEENITGLDWGHLYSDPDNVDISLADVDDPVVAFVKKQQSVSRGTSTAIVKKNKEYWTRFDQTDYYIEQVAVHTDLNGNILEQAGMSLNAQGVLVYARDNPNQVGSMFKVVSDSITAEVTRATGVESGLTGRLTVAENNITAEVTRATSAENSISGRVTVNSNKVAIVVEERQGQNVIKAASIVTAINEEGSSVAITADHVSITGNTKLSGTLEISDGNLVVKKSSVFQGNISLTTANSYIQAPIFSVPSSGQVRFIGTGTGETYGLTTTILKGMIKSFSVSGNTLTLTPFYGEPVNFSKATSVNLTGAWSGRTFTVRETGSGLTYSETPTYTTGSGYGSSDSITVNSFSSAHYAYARVLQSSAQGGNILFGFKIDARGQYNAGWIYGQSQITRTTRAATSQEITVKTLDYSERFTIVDTYTKPDGTTSEIKYTVASKEDRYTPEASDIGFDQLSIQPSTASIAGRTRAGSLSKSNISAPGYLFFRVGCRGTNKLYYIVVNT